MLMRNFYTHVQLYDRLWKPGGLMCPKLQKYCNNHYSVSGQNYLVGELHNVWYINH